VEPAVTAAALPQPGNRIHCCRSLRLDQVSLVGFDMDYTLAAYQQREMEEAAVRATLRRLVERGYPPELVELDCPPNFGIRGLLVDLARGNILKMDRYRYVKVAYHGLRRLSRDERRALYETRPRPRPGTLHFRWADTLYSMSDVAVYAALIDFFERRDGVEDYRRLYDDVRSAADAAHGSGEIYKEILADFRRFVTVDARLATALHRLRSSGKRLFLLTNSGSGTTEEVMGRLLDDLLPGYRSWRQFFDVVVTAAAKPAFFVGDQPFIDVEDPKRPVVELRRGRVYQGGNRQTFEELVGVGGYGVLYVGDHIYGDVLRANVESGWRTLMVIQELTDELSAERDHADDLARIDELDTEVQLLHDELRALPVRSRAVDRLVDRARLLEAERDELEARVDSAFHPYWGSLFKAGTELSGFGAQVEQYAWLYTDRVSNLAGYSPVHFFRSPRARMPHEL
jgi:HAD superfamily 5'-nucleotidase-like hydrolase